MSLAEFLGAQGYRQIPLSRNGVGHFEAPGKLEGREIRVLIDYASSSLFLKDA